MKFTDLFALMVIRHKVMTMTEFYNADFFDIDLVATHLEEVERDALERMRMLMWATLAPTPRSTNPPTRSSSSAGRAERKARRHPPQRNNSSKYLETSKKRNYVTERFGRKTYHQQQGV